jgi:hypothetical protein
VTPFGRPLPAPPTALLVAVSRLLRPLVQLLLRSGVTFPVLTDALRRLFVDVAATDILRRTAEQTDSRISLLTGINRKLVKQYREMQPDATAAPKVVTITSEIIARWRGSPPFVDDAGHPKPLPRTAEPGDAGLSFDALVRSVTTDIRSRAVLDDWLSQGIVQLALPDLVVLNVDAFVPRPGAGEQLFYFARNLQDHIAAAVANISAADAAPFLDRSVHYDGLTLAQARELEAFARETAVQALLAVNRKARELVEADPTPAADTPVRVNFGTFVFTENESSAGRQPGEAGPVPAAGEAE